MIDGRGHDRPMRMQCLAGPAQSVELAALEMQLDEGRFDVEAVDRTDADLGLAGRGQFRREAVAFAERRGTVLGRKRTIENLGAGSPRSVSPNTARLAASGSTAIIRRLAIIDANASDTAP